MNDAWEIAVRWPTPLRTGQVPLRVQARKLFWRLAMLWQRDGVPAGWLGSRSRGTPSSSPICRPLATACGVVQLTDLHCGRCSGQPRCNG